MPTQFHPKLDKNVARNWKPVERLEGRKAGLSWSDRFWYWVLSLFGLAVAGFGVVVCAYLHRGRGGGLLVGVGLILFIFGSPSQARRNGYRD